MICMWKHIHGLNAGDIIRSSIAEKLQIASLSSWIAAYVNDALGSQQHNLLDDFFMHTYARRVCDDNICAKVLAEPLRILC